MSHPVTKVDMIYNVGQKSTYSQLKDDIALFKMVLAKIEKASTFEEEVTYMRLLESQGYRRLSYHLSLPNSEPFCRFLRRILFEEVIVADLDEDSCYIGRKMLVREGTGKIALGLVDMAPEDSEISDHYEQYLKHKAQNERSKIMKAKLEKQASVDELVHTLGLTNHAAQTNSRRVGDGFQVMLHPDGHGWSVLQPVATDEPKPKRAKKSRTAPPQPRSKPRIAKVQKSRNVTSTETVPDEKSVKANKINKRHKKTKKPARL